MSARTVNIPNRGSKRVGMQTVKKSTSDKSGGNTSMKKTPAVSSVSHVITPEMQVAVEEE